MPILNYTTKVAPAKTVGQIQSILGKCKAVDSVRIDYKDGEPVAVLFAVAVSGSLVNFRLPCNADGVRAALFRDGVAYGYRTSEHAKCVAWRIVKDWVEAQLALVDANQAQMAEVFLPYAVVDGGRTMFQLFEAQAAKGLITDGRGTAAENEE